MKVMMIIKEKGNISITSKTVVGGTERFAQLMILNNPSIILTEIPTIISKSKKYFVSVKMEGPIQLASGQGQSTAELFEAAADNLSGKDSIVLKSIIKSLRTMPTRLLSETNYKRIIDEGNEKIINETPEFKKFKKSFTKCYS